MNIYDGKSPNDFITFEMMGTEHEFPQQNVHVSLEHCLFLPPLQYTNPVIKIENWYWVFNTITQRACLELIINNTACQDS